MGFSARLHCNSTLIGKSQYWAGRGTEVTAWFRCGTCSNAAYYSDGKAAATSVGQVVCAGTRDSVLSKLGFSG